MHRVQFNYSSLDSFDCPCPAAFLGKSFRCFSFRRLSSKRRTATTTTTRGTCNRRLAAMLAEHVASSKHFVVNYGATWSSARAGIITIWQRPP